jgi:hypothetical protein
MGARMGAWRGCMARLQACTDGAPQTHTHTHTGPPHACQVVRSSPAQSSTDLAALAKQYVAMGANALCVRIDAESTSTSLKDLLMVTQVGGGRTRCALCGAACARTHRHRRAWRRQAGRRRTHCRSGRAGPKPPGHQWPGCGCPKLLLTACTCCSSVCVCVCVRVAHAGGQGPSRRARLPHPPAASRRDQGVGRRGLPGRDRAGQRARHRCAVELCRGARARRACGGGSSTRPKRSWLGTRVTVHP